MNNSYKYIQGAQTKPPKLASKIFNLTCKSEKVWNTPYSVLKGPRYQELIKEELAPTVSPFTHNGTLSFARHT